MTLIELGASAPGEEDRRWFRGREIELVVWSDDAGVRLYHLRYQRPHGDGVLEWRREGGLFHHALDDGEGRGGRAKATPVLTGSAADRAAEPDLARIRKQFLGESGELDPALRQLVEATLRRADRS